MNSLCLSRSRRGVASLIGGVFLILIILSGFAFYTLINNANSDVQSTLKKMEQREYEKNMENLQINSVVPASDGTGLILDVTNVGSKVIRVRYIGSINNDDTDIYAQYNFKDISEPAASEPSMTEYIDPGKSTVYYYTITSFSPSGTYSLKIISEIGRIYTILYRGGVLLTNPTITLSISSGKIGDTILLSGTNFGSAEDVQILFDDEEVETAITYENGSFSVSFPVPDTSLDNPHLIRAVSDFNVDQKIFKINP